MVLQRVPNKYDSLKYVIIWVLKNQSLSAQRRKLCLPLFGIKKYYTFREGKENDYSFAKVIRPVW